MKECDLSFAGGGGAEISEEAEAGDISSSEGTPLGDGEACLGGCRKWW